MGDHGDETTRRQRRRTMPPAGPASAFPLHSDDVLGEIFLRLGPLKPSLLRASHVCKQWRSVVSDPGFLRRFRARHRQPSLLGVFTQQHGKALFRSVLDPPVIPSERFSLPGYGSWDLLGCRHGRVLIMNHTEGKAIVYNPVTGDQHRIAVPWEFGQNDVVANINGAVLCTGTAENKGHIHGACRSSPFKIVLVRAYTAYSAKRDLTYHMAHACVYSSKTRTWGKNVSALLPCDSYITGHHSVFAGNALYWYLPGNILKFDMGMESLRVIRKLPFANDCYDTSHIIRSKGGGVGIALLSYPTFQVWDMKNFKRKNNCHGGTRWVPRKSISLELGYGSGIVQAILGFDEDENAIFFRVGSNIFIVHLVSMKSKKLWRSYTTCKYHPYTSYYTAALETSADNASMTYGGDQESTAQGGSAQI